MVHELIYPYFLERVNMYLNGRVSLEELSEWILRHDPILLRDPSAPEARLAGLIDLCISDMRIERSSEEDIRKEILQFMGKMPLIDLYIGSPESCIWSGSNADVMELPVQSDLATQREGVVVWSEYR
jgi:hypothetical protein